MKGTEKIIKHNLKTLPLVDVYQLDYFQAVAGRGENDNEPVWVNFFLYHTGERTISVKVGGTTVKAIIEAQDHTPFRIRFADMLALYKVKYTDSTTLDDLETDFWTAFSGAPNDQYDVDQFCHSPWFEKCCCGEQRSVKELKERGDWEDIWFKMVPRRTINYPTPVPRSPTRSSRWRRRRSTWRTTTSTRSASRCSRIRSTRRRSWRTARSTSRTASCTS